MRREWEGGVNLVCLLKTKIFLQKFFPFEFRVDPAVRNTKRDTWDVRMEETMAGEEHVYVASSTYSLAWDIRYFILFNRSLNNSISASEKG